MTFALLEILVPLIVVFLLGLGIGWMVWRWRRRLVSFVEWNELATAANEANANVATVEAEKAELANEKAVVERERDVAIARIAELEAMIFEVEEPTVDLTDRSACLLYTSPSPRDLSTSRMPSSA